MKLGYEVSFYSGGDSKKIAQRMSSRGDGVCSPTHVIMEVRLDGAADQFSDYVNETYSSAGIGYYGRGGMYTTSKLIADGLNTTMNNPTFSADFWRDYRDSDNLINSVPVSALFNNTAYYPPATSGCADGVMGCQDSCSKTAACTAREAAHGECLVVIMFQSSIDPGYLQAVLANNGVPAYFCFLGSAAMTYIMASVLTGEPVIFYHYEPEVLPTTLGSSIQRVLLPTATARTASVSTHTFGEHGYGGPTDNPVKVDFPLVQLDKYSSTVIQDSPLVEGLLNRLSMSNLQIEEIVTNYVAALQTGIGINEAAFSAACTWLKVPNNYKVWNMWLEQMSSCSMIEHVGFTINGCASNGSDIAFPRVVNFHWNIPDPQNASLPYTCDGTITSVPDPITTSQACSWLQANYETWANWGTEKPTCTSDFYTYNVSGCEHAGAKRLVQYYWWIADAENSSLSSECIDGAPLPEPIYLDCEYVPYNTTGFKVVAAVAGILCLLLFICAIGVTVFREVPIIKRSQYQFLASMLFGGMLMSAVIVLYAGKPSDFLCTGRPAVLSCAFTLIFGSLMVKSLRVYRVFMSSAMKRVILSAKTMFKILAAFLLVDLILMVLWRIVDPVLPVVEPETVTTVTGAISVDYRVCKSGSFIFSGLIIFWKAILLFVGLYMSFLIRKVSTDFQESIWIFTSSLVVLFTSIIVLMLAYLVEMKPTPFFLFFAFMLLAATSIVMSLMVVPKILRHKEKASDNTTASKGTASASGGSSNTDLQPIVPAPSAVKPAASSSAGNGRRVSIAKFGSMTTKVRVTPVQQFGKNPSEASQHRKSHRGTSIKSSASSRHGKSTNTEGEGEQSKP